MSSTKSSRKVVRTESLLDEYRIYFSHVFSPLNKMKQQKNVERTNAAMLQRHQNYGSKDVEEDVDGDAEDYIKKRHQKFELSKWMSRKFT